jgi:hypothetical protein
MSAQPLHAALHDDPGQQAADAHGYGKVLNDLITMGTDLARLLHEQATAQAQAAQEAATPQPAPAPAPGATIPDAPVPSAPVPNAPVPDTLVSIAAAFDRAARAVRRGILLARSLAYPVPPAPDPGQHRAAARKRILREVEDTIQRPGADGRGGPAPPVGLQDSLRAELRDRLDGPDLDDDITGRPVADIITEICRDLGLDAHPGTRPFQRRTPDDIRQLCARAAQPSAARAPGAGPQPGPQDPGPQDPRQDAAERPPGPQPDKPATVPPHAARPRPCRQRVAAGPGQSNRHDLASLGPRPSPMAPAVRSLSLPLTVRAQMTQARAARLCLRGCVQHAA